MFGKKVQTLESFEELEFGLTFNDEVDDFLTPIDIS